MIREEAVNYNDVIKKLSHDEDLFIKFINIIEPKNINEIDAIYAHSRKMARVSSHDQKHDLDRQLQRLREYCYSNNIQINNEYKEIGSGLNQNRKKLNEILKDSSISIIIVEHKERLTRFGFEMLESSLQAQQRKIIVVENKDVNDDIVQDMIDILTSFCARIYGKRSAKNKVKLVMGQLNKDEN